MKTLGLADKAALALYSRRHEISRAKLRIGRYGYCTKHWERLYPDGEWFTWQCNSCQQERYDKFADWCRASKEKHKGEEQCL